MPTDTIIIQPGRVTATQLVNAGDGPTLIVNSDLVNTVFLGNTDAIKAGDPTGVVPLGPNGSIAVDGSLPFYGVIQTGVTPVTVYTIAGGLSNFLGITQGGGNLVIPSIQSPNFIHNVSGWQIAKTGNAEFNNLTIRGTFFGLDFIINNLGIFVYSGTPALGNLVGSWAPVAGANDGFGNAFLKDFTVYATSGGGYVNVSSNGAAGANTGILLNPMGSTHVTEIPQISGRANNNGLVNEIEILQLTSGIAGTGAQSTDIGMFSTSADSTIAAHLDQSIGGTLLSQLFKTIWNISVPISCTLGTVSNPTLMITDSWHLITMDAGWSTVAGFPVPQYRLNIDNTVDIIGVAQFTSAFTSQNLASGANVIPASYRPVNTQSIPPGVNNFASLNVHSTGVLEAVCGSAVTICDFNGQIRLGILSEAKVRRKEIFGIAVIVITIFLISVLVMVTMPIWLCMFLIRPILASPIQEAIAKKVTRQMVKGMSRAYMG